MAASMASAVFYAAAGAVLAIAGEPSRLAFGVIAGLAVAVAGTGLAASGRARCALPPAPAGKAVL